MSYESSKVEIFDLLKSNLGVYSKDLSVEKDDENTFYLNTLKIAKNKKPHFFGAVQIKKNYVSYHLMPVYVNPSLLDSISDSLKKRMQGKSCFNFTKVDKVLFNEIKDLTDASYVFYQKGGYI